MSSPSRSSPPMLVGFGRISVSHGSKVVNIPVCMSIEVNGVVCCSVCALMSFLALVL